MDFKIVNHFGNVDACAQFTYNGKQVSMSTIGRSNGGCPNEVAVYGGEHFQTLCGLFYSVEDAIKFINGDTSVTNLL